MSYANYDRAINLAKDLDGYLDGGGKSEEVIYSAEKLLGINFSEQNFDYFNQLGFIEFSGNEIYGIIKDDFSGIHAGNAIEATIIDRKDLNLPPKWLTIYAFGDGYYAYLDYSQLNDEGEPPVIMSIYNGKKFVNTEKIAEDLGDFLLELVENELEE